MFPCRNQLSYFRVNIFISKHMGKRSPESTFSSENTFQIKYSCTIQYHPLYHPQFQNIPTHISISTPSPLQRIYCLLIHICRYMPVVGQVGFGPTQPKHLIYSQARLSNCGADPYAPTTLFYNHTRESDNLFTDRCGTCTWCGCVILRFNNRYLL